MTTYAAHVPHLPGAPVAEERVSSSPENPGPLPGRRRRFSTEEKRQFITEAMSAGQSMSSVGRRHGLSVSLLFRWRRQLEGTRRQGAADQDGSRAELRVLRDRVRELERMLGRKTHELETLQQEMSRLGHNAALQPTRNGFVTTR
jgi:transposase